MAGSLPAVWLRKGRPNDRTHRLANGRRDRAGECSGDGGGISGGSLLSFR